MEIYSIGLCDPLGMLTEGLNSDDNIFNYTNMSNICILYIDEFLAKKCVNVCKIHFPKFIILVAAFRVASGIPSKFFI